MVAETCARARGELAGCSAVRRYLAHVSGECGTVSGRGQSLGKAVCCDLSTWLSVKVYNGEIPEYNQNVQCDLK